MNKSGRRPGFKHSAETIARMKATAERKRQEKHRKEADTARLKAERKARIESLWNQIREAKKSD